MTPANPTRMEPSLDALPPCCTFDPIYEVQNA